MVENVILWSPHCGNAKSDQYWFPLMLKIIFLQNCMVQFFHQRENQQFFTRRKLLEKNSLILSVGILIYRKVQKVQILLTYLGLAKFIFFSYQHDLLQRVYESLSQQLLSWRKEATQKRNHSMRFPFVPVIW